MGKYDRIIEYETENSRLDFKATQYSKDKYVDLLKDISAMANADGDEERLIIVGVKLKSDGRREYWSINEEEFVDSATYQEIIEKNIEPSLSIEYLPYRYDGYLLGVFVIKNCLNRPYMLKKDYRNLKKGACYIRKGSHQMLAARADYEHIYMQRNSKQKFFDNIKIGFRYTDYMQEQSMSVSDLTNLPSVLEKVKISGILEKKKAMDINSRTSVRYHMGILDSLAQPFGEDKPYEERSITYLEKKLENVDRDFKEDDDYELYERRAYRLNFVLFNDTDEYIQDATCIVDVKNKEDIFVSKKIFSRPIFPKYNLYSFNHLPNLNYPDVEKMSEHIRISQNVGELKHQVDTVLFAEDIRLLILNKPELGMVPLELKLYAKNLPKPIIVDLLIKVD